MPSFLDITELERLILEIVNTQSITPIQLFQIRQYYMQAKEIHAQGNLPQARDIMRVISGVPVELPDLAEYHFKATGYAEALLFAGDTMSSVFSAKSDLELVQSSVKSEPASRKQAEDTAEDAETTISSEVFGKKEEAPFDDF